MIEFNYQCEFWIFSEINVLHLFQVCQSIPAYTESNILNNRRQTASARENVKNKTWFEYEPTRFQRTSTISPIYLSRQLNAIPCSVAVCRDDSFSILGMIELSRRFSNGLWNCIQVRNALQISPNFYSFNHNDLFSFGCAVVVCWHLSTQFALA